MNRILFKSKPPTVASLMVVLEATLTQLDDVGMAAADKLSDIDQDISDLRTQQERVASEMASASRTAFQLRSIIYA